MIPTVTSKPIDNIIAEDRISALKGVAACNRINQYFCNISAVLSSKLKQGIPWTDPCGTSKHAEIWAFEIGQEEVLQLIDGICEHKSSGFFYICVI